MSLKIVHFVGISNVNLFIILGFGSQPWNFEGIKKRNIINKHRRHKDIF